MTEKNCEELQAFRNHAQKFATFAHVLSTKGKTAETRKSKNSAAVIYVSPAFCDDENCGKQFAYECISQLQSYCEACERSCCGYGKYKTGIVDSKLIANCVKMQHSTQFFVDLIDNLVENRANYADFVALLRHRCIKLPLNHLGNKLATNNILFAHVLQYFLCGFGSDEFAQSPKEQRKAEEVVSAFLKCPSLSADFDTTNGRLLFDAVLSPYSDAAKMVIMDQRVRWREDSYLEIISVLKDGGLVEGTRLFLLNHPAIYTHMTEQNRMEIECDPKIERFNY